MDVPPPGITLLHKPRGETSFAQVKRLLAAREAQGPGKRLALCHGGTLDPFAEGLLLILAGDATKLFDPLHALPKTYRARVAWGVETDNGDPTGRPVAEGDASTLSPERLEAALTPFLGWREQVPPATSAKKIRGEPAYKRAHRGEAVALPASRVYLHAARWVGHDLPRTSELELTCRGGFYVRSLVTDLGRQLGVRAHVTELHRTEIGPWRDPGATGRTASKTGADAVPWLPLRPLTDQEVGILRRGSPIQVGTAGEPAWSMPSGFPRDANLFAAVHLSRVVALLTLDGDRSLLAMRTPFLRGF